MFLGTRLRADANFIKISGHSRTDIVLMPVKDCLAFFKTIQLNETDAAVAKRILTEIVS